MEVRVGQLEGKTALVTGASRGIGRAIAERFVAEGASVAISASRLGRHGRLEGTLEEATAELGGNVGGARVVALAADLADEGERAGLIERAEQELGPLDILVNNAAMAAWGMPSAVALNDRRKMCEVNLHAPVDLAQLALPGMRARGAGWILNVTSESARQPLPPYAATPEEAHAIGAYGATKAALDRYTEALAHEVAPDGVFVNALAPVAIVLTPGAIDVARHIARANPKLVEPVELMVEAALELVSGRHVGRVVSSRALLHQVGRPVRSLDGRTVIGDAFAAVDLDAEDSGPRGRAG